MVLQLFRRALQEHFGFHLLIPLALVFGISAWGEPSLRGGGLAQWSAFAAHWPLSHVGSLIEIYLAFFMVVAWTIKRAGDVQSTRVETLLDVLPQTQRYFAIGVIPLREWFEPNTTVYLATIVKHQMANQDFSHERVLLFRRPRDLEAVGMSYLDSPPAKALAAIHREFKIPLSYLPPKRYAEVMEGLKEEHRLALRCERRWLSWCRSYIKAIPFSRTLRPLDPFVVLEQKDKSHVVMMFSKRGRTLGLDPVTDSKFIEAATAFRDAISSKVYVGQTRTVKAEFSFSTFLQL